MKILIDIGHPAHVHLFKYISQILLDKGHSIFFTSRDKEHTQYLLNHYKFESKCLGKQYNNIIGKLFGLVKYDYLIWKASLEYKPDLFLSHGSIYAAHASALLMRPHISLEDSGNLEQIRLYKCATQTILTPDVLKENLGKKQIRYQGYHELAYLLPKYFMPDSSVVRKLGLMEKERYCVLRFVSWRATHDKGQTGLNLNEKRSMINSLSKYLRVFISSESELPSEFLKYRIKISPDKIHDVLAFADLFIGEGATMASEAGVLGTPSIYVNSIVRYYNEDQEKYRLIYNFRNGEGVLEKALELLNTSDLKEIHQQRRKKMIADKIDVTAFMVWFVENYPESVKILKENPDYQLKFTPI